MGGNTQPKCLNWMGIVEIHIKVRHTEEYLTTQLGEGTMLIADLKTYQGWVAGGLYVLSDTNVVDIS